MKSCCVAVIGHVDHGKTTLVRALTGAETDSLPEEKARGLSIRPGFAFARYGGAVVDYVDLPGHENFIQAMISGASGAGAVLIVVSARKGVGAQTLEHLEIAACLGIKHAVVALNKSEGMGQEDRDARIAEVRATLAGTPFDAARIIPCSAITGEGVTAVHDAIELISSTISPSPLTDTVFLPIDRGFSMPGRGTVVTGTMACGALRPDAVLRLEPVGRTVTVRGVQSRHEDRTLVETGERVAVNLRDVSVEDVQRGHVLCTADAFTPSDCLDVHVTLSSGTTRPVKHMSQLRVSFGAGNAVAQIRIFGAGQLEPGSSGLAQLRFRSPIVAYAGQRFILRSLSPAETLGGAEVLDPNAEPTTAGDAPRIKLLEATHQQEISEISRALALVAGGSAVVKDIARLGRIAENTVQTALSEGFVDIGEGRVAEADVINVAELAFLNCLSGFHREHPRRLTAPPAVTGMRSRCETLVSFIEQRLLSNGRIIKREEGVALSSHDPIAALSIEEVSAMDAVEAAVLRDGLMARTVTDVAQDPLTQDLLALLVNRGTLLVLWNVGLRQELVVHADVLDDATKELKNGLPDSTCFTTSEARACLSTTRRVIVPLLEHFDTVGLTERNGNIRRFRALQSVPLGARGC